MILALQIQVPESRSSSVVEEGSPHPPCNNHTEERKQDLYLVVGSTRESGHFSPLIDSILGTEQTDMTHLKTFDGKAVTLDLQKSVLEKTPHIQGDTRTFDFAKAYDIKAVLLEKLPTMISSGMGTADRASIENLSTNYVGSCIEQIAKAMTPGPPLYIEWLPCMTLLSNNLLDLNALAQKNPFHAFSDMNQVFQSVFILGGDRENINLFPEEMRPQIMGMVETISAQLEFYLQQGAASNLTEMTQQLYWEVRALHNLIVSPALILLDLPDKANASQTISALKNTLLFQGPKELVGQMLIMQRGIKGIVYNARLLQETSFFNFLITDLMASVNAPYVKTYLESSGFGEVSIEKKTNPFNRRKNVWMIDAVKT